MELRSGLAKKKKRRKIERSISDLTRFLFSVDCIILSNINSFDTW